MKADLPKREPELLKSWIDENIYKLILSKPSRKGKYILHDGPPYANGDIHIGHALNKILKDIIIKYKTMSGYNSPYVPGWDCHGLPVEHQLFKELKINKSQISQVDFRKKAYDYALAYVNTQKEEFIRLGVFGDWENAYLTLKPGYEESIISSLGALVKKGYIYRGLKPVNWCFKCETALAEAEVEYEEHNSPSIYVKFKLDDFLDSFLVIWTTTPWTLVSNVAVAVHPGLTYSHIETEKGNLILAKLLLEKSLGNMGIKKYKLLKEFQGKQLEGLIYTHPFGARKGCVVLADYVLRDEGTGLVHIAPGHGIEDYFTGLKYKLEIIMPIDEKGNFDASSGELAGCNCLKANSYILGKLEKLGALLYNASIQHSYPHCWRCKNPVIFRATKQWFLKIDHDNLRLRLLEVIRKDIKWIPEPARERIAAMVESRPDWCLSRQRYWGVPIPALICNKCKEEFLEPKVIELFAKFTKDEGAGVWFNHDIADFIPAGVTCPHCACGDFSKGKDILDVWFDSGVSSQAVLKIRPELKFPSALYLEGADQHRGWFQSSLISAMCIDGIPPFESVLTHGFVVDGDGRKMSKSSGNVISPLDTIKNYGADILRLWVASSDYNEDIRISPEILLRLAEAYRKIRNTARFILSNLYDFDPNQNKAGYDSLKKIDKWILGRLQAVLDSVDKAYDSFEFHKAYKAIYDFCNEDLSMYYLDMVKGRLYTYAANSHQRRAAQTALFESLNVLVRIMAPILSFTAEEIWRNMPKQAKDSAVVSVHLLDWQVQPDKFPAEDLGSAIELVGQVAKALEEKRNKGEIGSSFDARINILTNNTERYKFLESLQGDLCEIYKVSGVKVINDLSVKELTVEAFKADGHKCARCWNYSSSVGRDLVHRELCDNCIKAVS